MENGLAHAESGQTNPSGVRSWACKGQRGERDEVTYAVLERAVKDVLARAMAAAEEEQLGGGEALRVRDLRLERLELLFVVDLHDRVLVAGGVEACARSGGARGGAAYPDTRRDEHGPSPRSLRTVARSGAAPDWRCRPQSLSSSARHSAAADAPILRPESAFRISSGLNALSALPVFSPTPSAPRQKM